MPPTMQSTSQRIAMCLFSLAFRPRVGRPLPSECPTSARGTPYQKSQVLWFRLPSYKLKIPNAFEHHVASHPGTAYGSAFSQDIQSTPNRTPRSGVMRPDRSRCWRAGHGTSRLPI
ncbi:hypothetical protein C8Q78DRAFT_453984 [Trametes maxima]|nr:hypothetical protein C8Q78DRAFT_453984 [Trametes maxima]